MKKGRPPKYTAEIGAEICRHLASGMTLRAACRLPDMPPRDTVQAWALDPKHPFYNQYTRAREIGYHMMADDIVDIIDDGSNDTYQDEDGNTKTDHDVIARSRLRFEGRKWILAKALPKIYGDKVAVTDADGGTLTVKLVA